MNIIRAACAPSWMFTAALGLGLAWQWTGPFDSLASGLFQIGPFSIQFEPTKNLPYWANLIGLVVIQFVYFVTSVLVQIRGRVSGGESVENLQYYLGFILTISAIGISMYRAYQSVPGEPQAPDYLEHVLKQTGGAIASTIVGLFLRIWARLIRERSCATDPLDSQTIPLNSGITNDDEGGSTEPPAKDGGESPSSQAFLLNAIENKLTEGMNKLRHEFSDLAQDFRDSTASKKSELATEEKLTDGINRLRDDFNDLAASFRDTEASKGGESERADFHAEAADTSVENEKPVTPETPRLHRFSDNSQNDGYSPHVGFFYNQAIRRIFPMARRG